MNLQPTKERVREEFDKAEVCFCGLCNFCHQGKNLEMLDSLVDTIAAEVLGFAEDVVSKEVADAEVRDEYGGSGKETAKIILRRFEELRSKLTSPTP